MDQNRKLLGSLTQKIRQSRFNRRAAKNLKRTGQLIATGKLKQRTTQHLRQASKLITAGKWREAVELLSAVNREQPDAVTEMGIIDLLLQSCEKTDPSTALRLIQTPRDEVGAPLCASGEIPEIPARAFTANNLRRAMHHHGHLIVRGLVPASTANDLRECIDHALLARVNSNDASQQHGERSPWYYASPFFPGSHIAYSKRNKPEQFSTTGSIRVADSPRGAFQVLELYRKLGLSSVLNDYFGEPALISTRKWVFRLVCPRKKVLSGVGGGWHQDGQFMDDAVRTLNMWVALSPCGDTTEAPGIALIPKRLNKIVEFGTQGAHLGWTVGPGVVEKLAEEAPIIKPHFNPGDALFFDHFSLHRSGHAPGQTQNRYALESWFYAQSAHATHPVIPLY